MTAVAPNRLLPLRAVQGLLGGAFAAPLLWAATAPTISGFAHQDAVELPVLKSPGTFPGSFFVALLAFAHTLVGGLLPGPIFGPFVERAASKEKELVR
ncbi:hypothetical protein GBA65_00385 [Rubrobacter marinus]|uniref:Uncharacterized protein n=1 Tax=Rubrobacter marinus TaxID=2653852 RepID=A0A6G8PSC0_9ACTN|nr:hypothetical protein [Rubrobacter marinus]QIN77223.1 hypothetical protein GBA65_00385 [Rubrobacter marinus]